MPTGGRCDGCLWRLRPLVAAPLPAAEGFKTRPPHGQARIIRACGTGAGENGRTARAPALHVGTRRFAGDPFRFAIGQRGAPIQAHRQFHTHPWAGTLEAREESAIQFARRVAHQAGFNEDTRFTQTLAPRPGDFRVGVFGREHHARNAGFDQCVRTRRRAAVVRTGFQCHVGARATCTFARRAQGEHFRVRFACASMPAFADDFIAVRDHAADARIGLGREKAAFGEAQRARHQGMIGGGKNGVRVTFHAR